MSSEVPRVERTSVAGVEIGDHADLNTSEAEFLAVEAAAFMRNRGVLASVAGATSGFEHVPVTLCPRRVGRGRAGAAASQRALVVAHFHGAGSSPHI